MYAYVVSITSSDNVFTQRKWFCQLLIMDACVVRYCVHKKLHITVKVPKCDFHDFYIIQGGGGRAGGHKEMSSILADQWRPRI